MKRKLPQRWLSLAIVAAIFFSPAFLQGCDSMLGENNSQELEDTNLTVTTSQDKLRHQDLLSRAVKTDPASKNGAQTLGLIFSVEPQKVFDRYAILDRYKIFDRYKILDRYEFTNTFPGFAITVEDQSGLGEYNDFLDVLINDPDVAWVEPDFSVDLPTSMTASSLNGQQVPWSVAMVGGKESWTVSGDGTGTVDVDVYILDTGVAMAENDDPDDDLRLVENIDFRGNAYNGSARDIDGHGTHIAGIIGAIDDYDNIVGVAPGVRIHNYKVLNDDGKTDVSVVIAAVEHLLAQKLANPSKPMVVNMSLGENIGSGSYTALDEAIRTATQAGVIFVAAAGNHGIEVEKVTPAHCLEVITVGSYDINGMFSSFSNYGPKIDILAPGEGVLSMAPDGTLVEMSGTSMATAHVTGAIALYLAYFPNATQTQVKAALMQYAKSFVRNQPKGTTKKSLWVGPQNSNQSGNSNQTHTLEKRIASDNDDAEERTSNGAMYLDSSDLELSDDGSKNQIVGMRFNDVDIPQGATITKAYIQFTVDEKDDDYTNLNIFGEDNDNAILISSNKYNLSSRARTSAQVNWIPEDWDDVGEADYNQRTPDLSSIVQEIVNRPGWSSDNLMILIEGQGERTAEAYDGSKSKAPLLHVEWQ